MELHLPELHKLLAFVGASIVMLVIPGPAVLFIVARGISQGRLAAFASVLGVAVGSFVHVIAAVVGLSALLATSALAFTVVKYVGAAYLIYLGVMTLLKKRKAQVDAKIERKSLRRLFIDGIVVNVLNPKTALFFLAFLPVFADEAYFTQQALFLGAVFVVLAILSDGTYAMLSGSLGHFLRGQPRLMAAQRWVTGGIYIGLGVLTALTERSTSGAGAAASSK
jgi:threonine/homoserine/homoserine lactone efflux protein